jgi:hypothetical protein
LGGGGGGAGGGGAPPPLPSSGVLADGVMHVCATRSMLW